MAVEHMTRSELGRWYDERKDYHEALTRRIRSTLEDLIEAEQMLVVSIRGSTKSRTRFLKKATDGNHRLDQIVDISRARVVTLRLQDRDRVLELLRREFEEVPRLAKPTDASTEAGYRGTNLILMFKSERIVFGEYARFKEAKFEVQVHTAFQHAWAELQHPRYELSGVLPEGIQGIDKRYRSVSEELDRLDRELDDIANDLAEYSADVRRKTRTGHVAEVESIAVDSTSLREFLRVHLKTTRPLRMNQPDIMRRLISELRHFGIRTLGDLTRLLSPERVATLDGRFSTVTGYLRTAMLLENIDRYFRDAWQEHWYDCGRHKYELIVAKYTQPKVDALLRANGIQFPGGRR